MAPSIEIPVEVEAIILKALQKDREYRFQNMAEMQLAFMTIMTKETSKLTVLRAGRRVEIEVNPKLLQGGNQGGDVQPATRR